MSISAEVKAMNLEGFQLGLLEFIDENKDTSNLFIVNVVSVARSGASRKMKFGMYKDGEFFNITRLIAKVINGKTDDNNALTVSGGGMDMVFATLVDFLETVTGEQHKGGSYRASSSYVNFS